MPSPESSQSSQKSRLFDGADASDASEEERADPEPPGPPETPQGYRDPVEFNYPPLWLAVGSFVLFFTAVVGFGWLMGTLRNELVFEFTLGPAGMATVVVALGATFVVHELVHGTVYKLLGYRVSYGVAINIGALYAAAFGQFQTRRDNVLCAMAPLAVFTVVLTPLLAGPLPVALLAFFVLVVNTSGAIGDLYITWRLLRMPPGTLLYDVDARHSYVFYPKRD
ncbi:DUF3267 domain-containing protein [Halorussus halophilus]|uniref:DUF3267 domain-containing protein n=1 Tax=Halorussus halophilus TaxID=2650975 RepID=UPI001300E26F|nr:DUF3267 domain-containing protein [Halorussus halophilus]